MTITFPNRKPPTDDETSGPDGRGDFTPPPRRPRRPLLTPVTGALAAVLIAALGFFGGVQVQKHSANGAGAGASAASGTAGLPSFGGAGAPTGARGSGGLPSFAGAPGGQGGLPGVGSNNGTQGTVAYVKHGVIYVKDSDGNTLKVKVSDGIDVTRTATTTAGKIHPGDTVLVQGKTSGSTITATRVTATAKTG